jgi:CRP-like cAMP-binding protein
MIQVRQHSIREILARLPLFRELSLEDVALLLPGIREYKAQAQEMIFHKGDQLDGIHALVMGQVKLFLPTPQGTERVIAMIGAGEAFGEAVVFLDKPCPVSAQATQDSLLLIVGKQALLSVLDRNPLFARKMLAGISMRLHELVMDMETCTLMSSVQRVVCFLSQQAPAQSPPEYEVKLDTNKQTLASKLNLAPETFSRVLHHLISAGLIEVRGRTIRIIDIQRLKSFQG